MRALNTAAFTALALLALHGCAQSGVSGAVGDDGAPVDSAVLGDAPDSVPDGIPGAVLDEEGPVVEVLAPKGGAALSGAVLVHVVATDPSGIDVLRVAAGPLLLADTNPLADVFLGTWDSVAAGDGERRLTVEARDTHGNTTWVDADVLVQNGSGRLVTGTVSAGAPVEAAAVVLRDWNDGLGGGEVLGSAVTDAEGRFTVTTLRASPSGWGLVDVRGPGGTATDAASGSRKTLKADDTLWSIVRLDDGLGAVVTRVNAWTTMSAGLAAGLRKAGTDRDAAPGKADALIAEHLQRPKPFDLRVEDVVLPGEVAFAWPSAGGVMGVTHLGLARLAHERGGDVLDAARVLAADLWDTKFDGKGALGGGQSGLLSWPDETPVGIEDTRYTLAAQMAGWAAEPGAAVSLATLDQPDGLLDTIANDSGPLYAKGVEAFPYDEDAPAVGFLPPTPAEGAWVTGVALPVAAVAKDKTPLAWMTLTVESGGTSAPVSATVDGDVLTATVDLTAVEDGALTLRVAAQDTSKQGLQGEAARSFKVDRAAPVIDGQSTTPAPGAYVAAKTAQVTVKVHDAASGVAQVRVLAVDCPACAPVLLEPAPGTDGVWQGTVPLAAEGVMQLEIEARDTAGNDSHLPYTLIRDTVPPTITAVQSEYVDAAKLELAVGTTEAGPIWKSTAGALVELADVCCLQGEGCEPGVCTDEIRMLASEQGCNPHTPVFNFASTDPGGSAVHVVFDLVVKAGEPADWLHLGPWEAPLGDFTHAVRLCSGVLGNSLSEFVSKPLEFRVRAVDTAGNFTDDIVIQLTLALVTPPLWIEKLPLTGAPDELQTYGYSNLDAHFPYSTTPPLGATADGYLAASWRVVNPHAVQQQAKMVAVAKYLFLREERRSYLKIGAAASSCASAKCSYIWADGEYASNAFTSGCTSPIVGTPETQPLQIESKTVLSVPGGTPSFELVPGLDVGIKQHSTVRVDVRAQTQGSCGLVAPVKYQQPDSTLVFYPVPPPGTSCGDSIVPTVPVVPKAFAANAAVGSCTFGPGQGWDYYNPAIVLGMKVVPTLGPGYVAFGLEHWALWAAARTSAPPIQLDLLEGSGYFPTSKLPSNGPY